MKKISAVVLSLTLLSLTLAGCLGVSAVGMPTSDYQFNIESFTADGYPAADLGGGPGEYIYYEEEIVFHDKLVLSGWMASAECNYKMEYSIDNGKNWIDGNVKFTGRRDLTDAGIPYPDSHAASAFSLTIPSAAFPVGESVFLDIRVVTLNENYINFLSFKSVTYVPGEVEFKFQFRVSLDAVGNGSVINKGGANTTAQAAASINAGDNVSILGWAVSNLGIFCYEFRINDGEWFDIGDNVRRRNDVLSAFPTFTTEQGNGTDIGFGRDDDYLVIPRINRLPAGEYTVTLRATCMDEADTKFDVMVLDLLVTGELPPESEAPTDAPTEEPTAAPTDAPTEAPTAAPTEAPTEAPASSEAPAEEKGCGSSAAAASAAALVLVSVLGAGWTGTGRKK